MRQEHKLLPLPLPAYGSAQSLDIPISVNLGGVCVERNIQDAAYLECLPVLYRRHHELWKARMLRVVDAVEEAFEGGATPEAVMGQFPVSKRDLALMVRLNFFTPEQAKRYDLQRIEEAVPQ